MIEVTKRIGEALASVAGIVRATGQLFGNPKKKTPSLTVTQTWKTATTTTTEKKVKGGAK